MTGFEEREQGFEKNFERQQELTFKAKARRNHLLGLWAAAQLGLAGAAAEAYARGIADPSQHLHGDGEIVAKIVSDLQAKGIALDATRVTLELAHFAAQAEKQLKS
ncbi:MAG TPA: ATPase inhibitor subunit zeta [Stellaceae bacterium]|nr:ATPase inhibitor subunit zeta [Stellaceae bacterium]